MSVESWQDHSWYWGVKLGANLVSQIDRHNQFQAGFGIEYTEFKERQRDQSWLYNQLLKRIRCMVHYDTSPVK